MQGHGRDRRLERSSPLGAFPAQPPARDAQRARALGVVLAAVGELHVGELEQQLLLRLRRRCRAVGVWLWLRVM